MSKIFGFYINLDERGEFRADLRGADGGTIFEISCEDDGSIALVEDGFMSHKTDLPGLEAHLKDLGIIAPGDEVMSMPVFEAVLEERKSSLADMDSGVCF